MGRGAVFALLYIYGQSFLNVTVALSLRQSELQYGALSYAKVFVYSSVRRLRPETIFCCLLAAEGSITRGRRLHYPRPRVARIAAAGSRLLLSLANDT